MKMNLQRKAGSKHAVTTATKIFRFAIVISKKEKKIKEEAEKKISQGNVSRKDTHVQPTPSGEEMKPPGVEGAEASPSVDISARVLNLNKRAFPVSYDVTEPHSVCKRH